ncbi:MAG: TlpA disulfide reductase family protein [Myxococcales bacterium]|nr:TlpA disulfide reductase family protein [Myxococcales bacterium]MDD9971753.1 TlpA disulfide reductase family protein [Myxococcales bacterium]
MNTKSPTSTIALLVAAVLVLCAAGVQAAGGARAGQPAPPLSGKTLAGKPVSLTGLKGRVVLIDFWASWCAPCKEEMPVLQKLNKKYGKKGLSILGVSVDDEADKAKAFIKKMGVTFLIMHDKGHAIAERYKPAKMPTSFIVDRAGKIRYVHEGFEKSDIPKLDKEIRSLL